MEIRTEPVEINAPIDVAWTVLTEVDKYSQWNPFTPQVRTDFSLGSPANLLVRMGPAKFRITETVCAFEKPRLIAWKKKFGAPWLLHAVREQHLEPVGKTSCSYHNTDRLTGLLAPMVFVCFGGYMRRGFHDVAEGLKAWAEALDAETGTNG
ncbi:MAG: SRPBCC domain-containing protein [Acidobacteriota bacterium]|nr:SRPBCC domain-containing protein [Acidobacteriota bacterium]